MSPRSLLLGILVANGISTAFHYWDNAVRLPLYPGPDWFTPIGVLLTWVAMTPLAAIGYWLYSTRQFRWAYACLGLYAMTGFFSPAHYFFPITEPMQLKMHVLIWTDAIAASALLLFLAGSAFWKREWR